MTPDELFADFVAGFAARKFSAGLLMAFVDFYEALGIDAAGARRYGEVIAAFPRRMQTAAGARANTLIVARDDGSTLSLRPFYNAVERHFRAVHKRFDYPSCAPHATQAWADYLPWLDALAGFSPAQRKHLRDRVDRFVLDTLASQAFDPATVQVEPPLFRHVLEGFDMASRKGEPTGAAFQGVMFGFVRADNPHLQIEIDKVRTGSRRLQRVGDIDGWDGGRLALSVEVKHLELKVDDVPDLEGFAHEVGRRGAIGIVAALGFRGDARARLEDLGLKPVTLDDLLGIVELWDPMKQRTAVSSLTYYARHVEKNASLTARLEQFLKQSAPAPAPAG